MSHASLARSSTHCSLPRQAIREAIHLAIAVLAGGAISGCNSGSGGGPANVNAATELYEIESGDGGYAIHGVVFQSSGLKVAIAGDVNGDGRDDVVIGIPYSSSEFFNGRVLVVFGKSDAMPIELDDIAAGVGGFMVIGVDGDTGIGLSGAGDVNGDGLVDIVVGSTYAAPGGQAYVVYGKTTTTPVMLSDVIAGAGGFMIAGSVNSGNFGTSVGGAGDFDGDGYDDVVIGEPFWRIHPFLGPVKGAAYIAYGQANSRAIDTRGGAGIRQIRGVDNGDFCGYPVSGAGDVNGDGFDDVIIGAYSAGTPERPQSGESYVVFGGPGLETIELSGVFDGIGGFVIRGAFPFDESGLALAHAGDVNNDSLADVIVGVRYSELSGIYESGAAYVVFGRTETTPVDLAEIESSGHGFVIYGSRIFDHAGDSVSGAGDMNGDGFDDVIVGAPGALFSDEQQGTGTAYVVYGKSDFEPVRLNAVEAGVGGFAMVGSRTNDSAGYSVGGGGDINGDGFFDVVVGAPGVGPGEAGDAPGTTYVVFNPFAPEVNLVRSK